MANPLNWNENNTLGTDGTLAGNASSDDQLNLTSLGGQMADAAVLHVSVTKLTASSVTVQVFGEASVQGAADVAPEYSYTVTTATAKLSIPVTGFARVNLHIQNDDGSNPTGTITRRYDYRYWDI